jgi:hypothetical protein
MTTDSRWETPDFKASRKILGDFALGLKLGMATFTPRETSSLRIDQIAQRPFLDSIQALEREGNHSRMKPDNSVGDYRPANTAGDEDRPDNFNQ